jgi:phosphate transport system permease protein
MKGLFKKGDVFLWLTGSALGFIVLLVAGLLTVVGLSGVGVFWPSDIVQVRLKDGRTFVGEIVREEKIPGTHDKRIQLKIGNRDVYGVDFRWVDEPDIVALSYPEAALVVERAEYGNFYGFLQFVRVGGQTIASGHEALPSFQSLIEKASHVRSRVQDIEKNKIGRINYQIEQRRLALKRLDQRQQTDANAKEAMLDEIRNFEKEYETLRREADELILSAAHTDITFAIADGSTRTIPISKIIRFYQPNQMSFGDRVLHYLVKIGEYLGGEPRESNTEGGVFPAIFGTVLMVLIMTVAVVPFGVICAIYLREYARQGLLVQIIRIAVNNLAGVPSIVFGIFGLGFFVYFCGGTLDQLFYSERLPAPTWGTGGILWASLTLALLTVPVVIVATEEALVAVPKGARDASLALGATKWQTTWRVVLPASTPGILTGVILAMARGAGEVAPLMITGVVKLAPTLPLDANFPFLHLDRKFMHLGFHIYDVGFQSPNVEAAKPMVYMSALLLILLVLLLNWTAIVIRAKLRKKYQSSTF